MKRKEIGHDTFSGIPKVSEKDEHKFYNGEMASPINVAKEYLKKYKNVYFYKGVFPDTSGPIRNSRLLTLT